jgi:hypothetical protein
MADLKISELSALAGGDLVAADELAIVDDSASETKKITVSNLIANGVTLISDDTIPGAKILFGAGDIATAALADSAVTAAKINADAVTSAKIADNTIVNLVSELPASGGYTGQLALDTDDNSLYVWNGTSWLNTKAPASVNAFTDTSAGIINIATSVSGGTATVTASIDDTTAAAQFLAGPVGSAGTVGYRAIDGGDLPTATTTAKGGVVVNGNGLVMDGNTIEIDNSVTQSSVNHLVTYDANGLITGGRVIASSDLPVATTSARGAVIASTGLAVDASGNLSIDNTVTSGTYTKVTVTAQGIVSAGDTLSADDIPDHSAAKLTSGTIGSSLIANDAVTAAKLADQSTVKFGGAAGSDNVTIFPAGDFKGQMFWDETSEDLYIYSGSAFVPITVLSGNLVNAGAYNANTNLMSSVTTAGSSAGFSAGAALPAPAAGNLNHYVVVDTSGTGSGAAPAVALAPPDMLLSQGVGTEYSLIDVSNAIAGQTASNISVVASGNIAATDVQAALQELDTEKLQKSGDTMTGALGIGTASSIVFEGSSADDYETTLTVTDPTADRTITLPNVTGTVVTTGDTGSVTSTMITDGTIVNADISSSAEIAVSKLANGTARQLLQTAANGSDVEFTSNVDVPGTLDVTGAATLDSTLTVTGLISADGKVSFPAGTAAAPSLYPGSDTDTGIYSPGSNQFGITTNGTSRVVVDSSGNVGVGMTPTNYSGYNTLVHAGSTGATFEQRVGTTLTASLTTDSQVTLKSVTSIPLVFSTANTEAMRIDSSQRVGINTTSPSVNLDVSPASGAGEVRIAGATSQEASIRLYASQGAAAADIKRLLTDTSGNFKIQHYSGSNFVDSLTIDSSGNVGVGGAATNTASTTTLQVTDGTTARMLLESTGSGGRKYGWYTSTDGQFAVYDYTASSERLRIDSSGLVNVAGGLQVSQNVTPTSGFGVEIFTPSSTVGQVQAFNRAGNTWMNLIIKGTTQQFYASGSEAMRIDSTGVGINTTSPRNRLDLGPNGVSHLRWGSWSELGEESSHNSLVLGNNVYVDGNSTKVRSTSGDGYRAIKMKFDQGITFHTTDANVTADDALANERMRIGSNGHVLIGTQSEGAGGGFQTKFAVSGTDASIFKTTGVGATSAAPLRAWHDATSGNNIIALFHTDDIATRGSITYNRSSNVLQYNTTSDARLKTNIVNSSSALGNLSQVQVRSFDWIEEGHARVDFGFIAQELNQVIPGAVKAGDDGDEVVDQWEVDNSKIVPLLTKALQEAIAKIETLEAKVAALEAG